MLEKMQKTAVYHLTQNWGLNTKNRYVEQLQVHTLYSKVSLVHCCTANMMYLKFLTTIVLKLLTICKNTKWMNIK